MPGIRPPRPKIAAIPGLRLPPFDFRVALLAARV